MIALDLFVTFFSIDCFLYFLHVPMQIYGPNFVGLILATIQMSLFLIYGLPSEITKPKTLAVF